MDLKTRIEVLPCGMCEEMMGCDTCLYSKEAHDLYYQIRTEVIDEYTNKLEELMRYGIFVTRNELLEDILVIATEIKEQNK